MGNIKRALYLIYGAYLTAGIATAAGFTIILVSAVLISRTAAGWVLYAICCACGIGCLWAGGTLFDAVIPLHKTAKRKLRIQKRRTLSADI